LELLMLDELERLDHPTKPDTDAIVVAEATIWPCQICGRPRFSGYDLANSARILLPAKPQACPDCGDGSFR
jgi:hypothetical protein